MTNPPHAITLRRNRIIGVVAAVCLLGLGSALAIVAWGPPLRPVVLLLALVMLIPGTWAVLVMLRPWHLDGEGVRRFRGPGLSWPQVRAVEVADIRPVGAGRGPAHVTVVLRGDRARAVLVLYSRPDAEAVAALLEEHLPGTVAGRESVPRIAAAWTGIR